MKYPPPCVWLTIAGVVSCSSYSQSADLASDTADSKDIETTEIIGVKEPQEFTTALVDKSQYTGFNQTIARSDFEKRLVNFGEMLNQLPGIQVKQSGGFGSSAQVAIRGTGNKRVNVFVDGMPMNSPASGYAKLQNIPPVLIEQVDVYPYFTPLELGNANLGGALNFSTRDIIKEHAGGQVSGGYGSFSTSFADISAWGGSNGYQGMVGLSHLKSENDFDVKREAFQSHFDTTDGSIIEKRQNDAVSQQSVFFKAAKAWDEVEMNLLFQHYAVDKALPTPNNHVSDDARFLENSLAIQTRIDYEFAGWQFGHRPFVLQESTKLDDPNNKIGLESNRTRVNMNKVGLANHARKQFDQHQLAINLELEANTLSRRDAFSDRQNSKTRRESLILAASDRWTVSPDVNLVSVVRYYQINDDTGNINGSSTSRDIETVWHSGLSWAINQQLRFNTNIGQSTRIPSLYEKFGSSGLFEGNPELKREKATSFDIGFNYTDGRVNTGINGFVSQIDDGIVMLYVTSGGVGRPDNIGKSMIGGIAFDINWNPLDWLVLGGNATLLFSENLSKMKGTENKQVPGIYHNSFSVFMTVTGNWIEWNIHYGQDANLFYEGTNDIDLKADNKYLLGTGLRFFVDRFSLDITARNLLNKNYRDFNYQPMPGQSFVTTLSIDI